MFGSSRWLCDGPFGYGPNSYGGIVMMILGLVAIIAIIWFVYKGGSFLNQSNKESALEVLQKRYVNGEISREEFEEKKSILK